MDNKVFLFPLTNSVLFKKVTLPYHIFEPRYRQMIKDSLAMQIPIAIVPFHSSNQYRGEICVAGLPHILSTYPDGRMDIYITGSVKCRLTDFEAEDPYKIYYYKIMEEDMSIDDTFDIELESLRTLLERWAIHFLPDPVQRESFSNTLDDAELLVNYCAVFLVDDWNVKKAVMEAEDLKAKIKILLQVIGPKEISLGPFMPILRF
ncbi:LON peptidase substrate-binding domain-containing protein [Peredibacter sp. HCB2-198]|uniref:LON peptidase substrate-binding domain-containing protein n=1 Tax=Peredibacter sp. HCB2-198 TaxID=3383025 RepID=UPI0038B438EB